jgi:hypothetical protein
MHVICRDIPNFLHVCWFTVRWTVELEVAHPLSYPLLFTSARASTYNDVCHKLQYCCAGMLHLTGSRQQPQQLYRTAAGRPTTHARTSLMVLALQVAIKVWVTLLGDVVRPGHCHGPAPARSSCCVSRLRHLQVGLSYRSCGDVMTISRVMEHEGVTAIAEFAFLSVT